MDAFSLRTISRVGSFLVLATLVVAPMALSQVGTTEDEAATQESEEASKSLSKMESDHLPNPVRIHPKVISGGLPESDEAFQELADLGVKTIISVNGMTPDIETAGKYGLRYVHLPHGYDGISDQRTKELAKAVRDLEGPIYIHCHHGKHRSPAAASVACVSAGLIPSELAIPILKLAGTNPGYVGLYDSARRASAFETQLLDQLEVEFKEIQEIPPMAEAMVHLSHANDHVALIAEAGWTSPEDHPDLDPSHEVLLLRELFTELLRTEEVASEPEDFRAWLANSEAAAKELRRELEKWKAAGSDPEKTAHFAKFTQRISASCKACHVKYRDIPISQPQAQ
ncbi:hypothetical protein KOR42_40640 [Thalassoglobus neptunius]|uniref:Uncharacterized protein n=1 Tax=Thalassoglobus neptunius TaxID=1938619 RepID=A0A5C5WBC6_9PLAN|nr:hypothetical protein [Thalassoglobus neptunius]TWT47980.1 hypothetical protein KOR42_40640 [Thalassoglobus neptunius]